jgi:hypothetical protein
MGGGHFFLHQQPKSFFNNAVLNIITIASAITIKLTSENYMVWHAQVDPLLRSHMLMGYANGSIFCPILTSSSVTSAACINSKSGASTYWTQ